MSYLIENSDVITKQQYDDNEDKYIPYQKYPLGDHYILTENKKPFFSIYDIANFCKKRYKKDKLFLIVHRYFDGVLNTKVTEFYIFNTLNIFDKALTSFLFVQGDELIGKQKVLKINIKLAKQLLQVDNLHIILGDNVKEHEVVEYLDLDDIETSVELFDSNEYNPQEKFKKYIKKYETPKNIRVSRISRILKTIRILEPNDIVIKRYMILIISALLFVYFIDDYMVSTNEDYIQDIKREMRNLQIESTKVTKELNFKKANLSDQSKTLDALKMQKVYKPE